MFACMECGRKFRSVKAAERAVHYGCPKCGGVDIDLDANPGPSRSKFAAAMTKAERSLKEKGYKGF